MMTDTADLLEFTITNIIMKRPTLILVYYPSKYDFYWFVARLVGLLKRQNAPSPLPQIREKLEKVLKNVGTQQIIHNAQKDSTGYSWTEFLGNYASKNRNEDSIFSSTLALNALLDIWTTRKGNKISFD